MSIGPATARQTLIRDIELIALDTLNRMAYHHHGQINMWADRLAARKSASPAALKSSVDAAESTLAEHQAKYDQIMAELMRREAAQAPAAQPAPVKSVEYCKESGDFEIKVNGEIIGYAGTKEQGNVQADAYIHNLAEFQRRIDAEAAQAAPPAQAFPKTESPAQPYQTTYKAGRDVLAEANTILHADKAAGIWTDEHARADQLADQLAEAQAWVSDYRNRADRCQNKDNRARLYEKANESSLCASEHESELAEAMANIAAGDTSHQGPWIEEADPLAGIENDLAYDEFQYGTPSAAHDVALDRAFTGQFYDSTADAKLYDYANGHGGYSRDYETGAPEDSPLYNLGRSLTPEQEAALMFGPPDPAVVAYDEAIRADEAAAELYALEYAAGVEETQTYKGAAMPNPTAAAVPTVETSTAAQALPQALADLRRAASARDLAYGRKAEAKEELDRLEAAITAQIVAEVNPENGKPLYSNDAARKAAIRAALDNYQEPANYLAADDDHRAACTAYDLAEQDVKTYRALLAYHTAQLQLQTEIMATARQNDSIPF